MLFSAPIEYYKPWPAFWIIQFIALSVFALGIISHFLFILKGKQTSLQNPAKWSILARVFWEEVLCQRQLHKQDRTGWLMHLGIFLGFSGLCFLSLLQSSNELILNFRFDFSQYPWKGFLGDLFGLFMLAGLTFAIIRRFCFRYPQLRQTVDDKFAVQLLFTLVVTGFVLRSLPMALAPLTPSHEASYFSLLLAKIWGLFLPYLSKSTAFWENVLTVLWVFHSLLTAVFVAYIPFSKLVHILFAPVELLLNAVDEYHRRDIYG